MRKKASGAMSRADYYRQQAQLLLTWALATSDRDYAARLEARACILLAAAENPEDPAFHDLTPYADEFNNQQMRMRDAAPVRQQQQQQQPQRKDDDKH